MLMIPPLVRVSDGAFLADDTLIGGYELGGGWLRVEHVKIGKRAFVGNSGMAAPGRKVPKQALVAVLSAAPQRGTAKAGTSWLGSPPRPLRRDAGRRRRHPHLRPAAPAAGGAAPSSSCAASCRSWLHVLLVVLVVGAWPPCSTAAPWWAVLLGGPVLLVAGARRRAS